MNYSKVYFNGEVKQLKTTGIIVWMRMIKNVDVGRSEN